ncbi:cation diffusion facilitator family transporter [Domibacillus sp. A3M-37]|uniref:cation diffusion facilitator family transporter n=1 Tax=Domibacillus TaxID=1433999 RepID=UPI0006182031|nr:MULTISPECIES: cation diffusion facilitator family transporter [Domibacillus]MCP3762768.1 cation diffusion facilitator family transporter [Domibacillus sp. A3M-37]
MAIVQLLRKGNTSSGIASLGNTVLAILKFIAAAFSGSGTMFASAMHSLADAINQGFVFFGSSLAEMKPSKRFPTGFGRVVNIFCMIAVIVVSIMAYETILKGWKLLQHPEESTDFLLNAAVLLAAFIIDGFILFKAMKEILHEARVEKKGNIVAQAFKNVGKASPATRLVFYEDIVATSGAVLAFIGISLAQVGVLAADGVITILIGLLMVFVAFRVGYDNMVGLIGVAAPVEVETKVGRVILEDADAVDIHSLRIMQEGRSYHVDGIVELRKGLTLADADDIKFRVKNRLLDEPEISDVTLGIIEDDGTASWSSSPNPL